MKIKEVMHKTNIALRLDDNLLDGLKIFKEHNVEAINIVDDNNLLIGINRKY